jgi:hypothetical protein
VTQHVALNDIALPESPFWRAEDGAIVGMAMLGVRGERGWIGGFGIAAPYRGRGLSHQLIEDVIERARRLGLAGLQLEVITTNHGAIRVYERAGFVHRRDLLILARGPDASTLEVDTTVVRTADPARLIAYRPAGASAPAWQREAPSLGSPSSLEGLVVGVPEAPLALVLSRSTGDAARVADLAAVDQESALAVLSALIERHAGSPLTILNEPEGAATLPALFDLGWREIMRQHELALTLRPQ